MKFADVKTDLPIFAAKEDNRHALRNDAFAREGVVFMLQFPDKGIAGFVYFWINADATASASTCIFGPGVDEPIQERFEAVTVPASMDFYDWNVDDLSFKIDEPHISADVAFRGKIVDIAFRFEAMHPVYAFSFHQDGCPQYYADDRTEHHGRIVGSISIKGETFEFDTFCQRDHSWGSRVWALNQHYKWFHATTNNSAIHFFEMQSFGTRQIRGFVCKDGLMSQVVDVEYQYLFDDDMHQKAIDVVLTDEAGRRTFVSCKRFAKFEFDANPQILLKEAAITVEIEGESGSGWCEFCWNREYLSFAKDHVEQFAPYKTLTLQRKLEPA